MAKKILYTFTVPKTQEVDETVITKNDAGEEVKTITKVKKEVPQTFYLLKPTRSQIEDAELFYGVSMAKGMEAGLLPKHLLAKRYEESGGYVAKQEQEKRKALYVEFEATSKKIINIESKPETEQTEQEKAEIKTLTTEYYSLLQKIQKIEAEINSLFEHTAEVWAKNKTMVWWALNLAAKDVNGVPVDFFEGKDYEQKMEYNDKLSETPDAFTTSLIQRFMFLIGYWYNGHATDKTGFDTVMQYFEAQNGS